MRRPLCVAVKVEHSIHGQPTSTSKALEARIASAKRMLAAPGEGARLHSRYVTTLGQ